MVKENDVEKSSKPNTQDLFYGDAFLIESVNNTVTIAENEHLAVEKKGFFTPAIRVHFT